MNPFIDHQAWVLQHDPLRTKVWEAPLGANGWAPASRYVETFWLPLIGPSATWALRYINYPLAVRPTFTVPLSTMATSLGIGHGFKNSAVVRAVARLVTFGLARIEGDVLAVRSEIPTISARHIGRLPPHLVTLHNALPRVA